MHHSSASFCLFFFFNDTATTEIYTLSLHDALPICRSPWARVGMAHRGVLATTRRTRSSPTRDRKSTRLNSSHLVISYAVFCLKKKKKTTPTRQLIDVGHPPSQTRSKTLGLSAAALR